MLFEVDKNYARQHYAKKSLLLIFISILIIFISLILIVFYVSNIAIMILNSVLIILSTIICTVSIYRYFKSNFCGLSIFDNKIILIKEENSGGYDNTNPHLYKKSKYIFEIISLKEIVIKNKFICVCGNINMKKEFGAGNTFAHTFDKKQKNVSLVKIPRIFVEEDKIISSLNDIKKGVV